MGHIKGAVSIPGATTAGFKRRPVLGRGNGMVIYGRGGDADESKAVIKAMSMGYKNVRFYDGGIRDWSRKNFTVCSLRCARKAPKTSDFFLRLVDENNVLVGADGLRADLVAPPDKVRQIASRIPRDKNIILYGAGCEKIAMTLIGMGYRRVKTITNGNSPWQERLASAWPKDCY